MHRHHHFLKNVTRFSSFAFRDATLINPVEGRYRQNRHWHRNGHTGRSHKGNWRSPDDLLVPSPMRGAMCNALVALLPRLHGQHIPFWRLPAQTQVLQAPIRKGYEVHSKQRNISLVNSLAPYGMNSCGSSIMPGRNQNPHAGELKYVAIYIQKIRIISGVVSEAQRHSTNVTPTRIVTLAQMTVTGQYSIIRIEEYCENYQIL